MNLKFLFVSISVVSVSGCSTPLHLRHDTKASDSPQYFADRTECNAYANSSATATDSTEYDFNGNFTLYAARDKEEWTKAYYKCMRGKGWYAVDKHGNRLDYRRCNYPVCF